MVVESLGSTCGWFEYSMLQKLQQNSSSASPNLTGSGHEQDAPILRGNGLPTNSQFQQAQAVNSPLAISIHLALQPEKALR